MNFTNFGTFYGIPEKRFGFDLWLKNNNKRDPFASKTQNFSQFLAFCPHFAHFSMILDVLGIRPNIRPKYSVDAAEYSVSAEY